MTLNDPDFNSLHCLTLKISEMIRDTELQQNMRHSMCHFEWPWVTLSEIFIDTKHRAFSLRQMSFLFDQCL